MKDALALLKALRAAIPDAIPALVLDKEKHQLAVSLCGPQPGRFESFVFDERDYTREPSAVVVDIVADRQARAKSAETAPAAG